MIGESFDYSVKKRRELEAKVDKKADLVDGKIPASQLPSGVGGDSIYDVVIRTQAEFDTLVNSPDWLGAKSVCFVGGNGSFNLDNEPLEIPVNVATIMGISSPIVKITDFNQGIGGGGGHLALLYKDKDDSVKYSITGLTLVIETVSNEKAETSFGFNYCPNLTNCHVYITSRKITGRYRAVGFYGCYNMVNCSSKVSSVDVAYGFQNCYNLINCVSTGTSKDGVAGYGYASCHHMSNCIDSASSSGALKDCSKYDPDTCG